MTDEPNSEVIRLFDELIALEPSARATRLAALAPPSAVSLDVVSLLAAATRAGDFLGVLNTPVAPARDTDGGALVASRYRLIRTLGSGATGDVHLAWDTQLERSVALKFLRAPPNTDGMSRFVAEARTAARLDHPHVATVHDIDDTERRSPFIVMTYYPGETLRDRLTRGPLAVADAVRIAGQIASALAAAHAAGIIHRDVKPANVLFDAEGAVRLADFGAAKLAAVQDATDAGVTIGTIAYMSPEQARGSLVDGRTDLWSLGVVLYEMLTGQRPFAAENADALLHALVHDDPRPFPEGDAQIPPALRALVGALLARDAATRPVDAAAVRATLYQLGATDDATTIRPTPATGIGMLPNAVTSFIGREREIERGRTLLDDTRLLTLTGPGGTGKTRLALEIAAAVRDEYDGGVWFVPLAEISEADLVPSMVAQGLGVRDLAGGVLSDRVIGALRTRRALLVLDNFEHVLGAGRFVARLLAECPGVKVLTTSRTPLAVQGEQECPVPPLTTPARTDVNADASEAVRLFVQRARAVRPNFALDAESASAVAEICRRLDGLPLALELAAARAKLLSPRAILTRLEHRFDLLRTDAHDRPARHGTMRALIDWSYVLLTDTERALFDRLSIFAGGVSVAAAEAVAPPCDAVDDAPPVLDVLGSLCNKSLLRQEDEPDGEPRFVMLETVREFGLERLRESDDEVAARRAHRAYCITLAEHAARELRGRAQAAWVDRLEREYANFRVALEDALADATGGSEAGLADTARLAVALHRLWFTRGPLAEGAEYIRRVVAVADAPDAPALDTILRARLLNSAGQMAGAQSVFTDAAAFFARSLALYRAAGDEHGIATTLNNLAWQVWNLGDLAGGEAMSTEAMAMHRARGNDLGIALSRNNLAWIAMERGEFALAESHFEAVISSHMHSGDRRTAAFTVSWLGMLVARRGDLARAIALHEHALEIGAPVADDNYRVLVLARIAAAKHALGTPGDHVAQLETEYVPPLRELGRLWPLASVLSELGAMLFDRGELDRARTVLEEALDVRRRTGGVQGAAEARVRLGVIHHQQRDDARAVAYLDRALTDARAYGAIPIVLDALDAIATRAFDHGRHARAATLQGAAAHSRIALEVPRAVRDERANASLSRALTATLSSGALGRAAQLGADMPLDAAITLALDDLRGV